MPLLHDDRVIRTTELRHVSNKFQLQLSNILGSLDAWKQLMAAIPRRQLDATSFDESTSQTKYKHSEIKDIDLASKSLNQPPTIILFDEWGTSGQVRPTVGHLMTLLLRLEFYRAADFVAVQMLNEPAPIRPTTGPASRVDISLSDIMPDNSLNVSSQQNTMNNQNHPNKMGPSEVQKVESVSIADLIEFSALQSNRNLNGLGPKNGQQTSVPNESINLIQFSSNNVHQSNNSSHYDVQSSQIPMLQELLPSTTDISSVIPQFSTLLGSPSTTTSNDSIAISTSAFIPVTIHSDHVIAHSQSGSSSENVSSASSLSTDSQQAPTIIPDESSISELSPSGMLPAMLDDRFAVVDINSISDDVSSSSGNIPLLSAIGQT